MSYRSLDPEIFARQPLRNLRLPGCLLVQRDQFERLGDLTQLFHCRQIEIATTTKVLQDAGDSKCCQAADGWTPPHSCSVAVCHSFRPLLQQSPLRQPPGLPLRLERHLQNLLQHNIVGPRIRRHPDCDLLARDVES